MLLDAQDHVDGHARGRPERGAIEAAGVLGLGLLGRGMGTSQKMENKAR